MGGSKWKNPLLSSRCQEKTGDLEFGGLFPMGRGGKKNAKMVDISPRAKKVCPGQTPQSKGGGGEKTATDSPANRTSKDALGGGARCQAR